MTDNADRADQGAPAALEPVRTPRSPKGPALLGFAVAGAIGMLAWTQPWVQAVVNVPSGGTAEVAADGSVAAPALTALSLAVFALVAALAIAGHGFRLLLAGLGVLLGASIALEAVLVLRDPIEAAAGAITERTGISGTESVHALTQSAGVTAWPLVAMAGALLALASSVYVIATSARWPGGSRRYRAAPQPGAAEATAGGASEAPAELDAEGYPIERGSKPEADARRRDAIDNWDDLTRGEDPTRD